MKKMYNVLVIEDDSFIRKVLRRTLNQEFAIVTKENGFEALQWLEEGNPVDIVLSDIQMPHMNGKEFITVLRASAIFRRLPVIMLSGSTDSDTRINYLNMGADDYIIKPFNPLEIKTKINAVLRRTDHDHVD